MRWSAELKSPETKIVFPAELVNLVYDECDEINKDEINKKETFSVSFTLLVSLNKGWSISSKFSLKAKNFSPVAFYFQWNLFELLTQAKHPQTLIF